MRSPSLSLQTPLQNANTIKPILNDHKPQHDTNAGLHPQHNHANEINFHHNKTPSVTTDITTVDHNSTSIKPFKPSNKIETGDSKQLPSPIKDPKIITSPAEVRYHRKVTLKDADINTNTKGQLEAMCKDYDDIFSKHMTDIGKTNVVQMSLQPKDNIKPLNQKPYALSLRCHVWLRQELIDLKKGRNNIPIYFKWCKSGYYSYIKERPNYTLNYIQDGGRI